LGGASSTNGVNGKYKKMLLGSSKSLLGRILLKELF
jgi:hypothetical protein